MQGRKGAPLVLQWELLWPDRRIVAVRRSHARWCRSGHLRTKPELLKRARVQLAADAEPGGLLK